MLHPAVIAMDNEKAAEFRDFSGQMLMSSELYLGIVSSELLKKLLGRSDTQCGMVASLMRECLVTCVLHPALTTSSLTAGTSLTPYSAMPTARYPER